MILYSFFFGVSIVEIFSSYSHEKNPSNCISIWCDMPNIQAPYCLQRDQLPSSQLLLPLTTYEQYSIEIRFYKHLL